jgi:EAL and modified HD-GYP domain-containing signal transduction protein
VSVQAIMDIGLDDLVGVVPAWVNVPRGALVTGQYQFLPPQRVVVEVLEDVSADPDVILALRAARQAGYRIALDDFVLREDTRALVQYADYVKVDVLGKDEESLRRELVALARPGLRVLAEKIETPDTRNAAVRAGYDLYQGYFYARPEIVPGRRLSLDRNSLLRLLAELQDVSTPLERIEELVASDIGLGVRLLRYVNAVSIGVRTRIDSLRHAIVMLGLNRLRQVVSMLLLAGLHEKPSELVTLALARARMCELLGARSSGDPHQHFSVGLLSLLDAFLDQPLEQILKELPLAEELLLALLEREGELGSSLAAVEACERADWDSAELRRWDPAELRSCYVDAVGWSSRVQSSLAAA